MVNVQGTIPAPLVTPLPATTPTPSPSVPRSQPGLPRCARETGAEKRRHGEIWNITVIKEAGTVTPAACLWWRLTTPQARRLIQITYEAMWIA